MLLSSERPLAEVYDLALVDLDGVAYRGHDPIPHAADSLSGARTRGMRLVFVTNNASREPEQVADQLTGLGIAAAPDEVMTAAQAAAALLARHVEAGSRVLVVGGAGLVTAVTAAGFAVVHAADDDPAAVVQGFAPTVGWRELAEAAYAIEQGALHVASNLDLSLPTERGFAPGNGALVGAVRSATGITPLSAGKPQPDMYRLVVERSGASNPLVVGDRLDTDLEGAVAAGYPGLHVLTGVSSARDAVLAPPSQRPSYLAADLRDLLEPHRAPVADDGWWVLGDAAARVQGGRLELRDGGSGVDLARAACAAVWTAGDEGSDVDPSSVPELGAA
nr:HAD-IIA family hydrolase [uncultured Actinotalea sp.]